MTCIKDVSKIGIAVVSHGFSREYDPIEIENQTALNITLMKITFEIAFN